MPTDTPLPTTGSLDHLRLLALAVSFTRGSFATWEIVRDHCPGVARPSIRKIPEAQRRAAADALLGELGGTLGRISRAAYADNPGKSVRQGCDTESGENPWPRRSSRVTR